MRMLVSALLVLVFCPWALAQAPASPPDVPEETCLPKYMTPEERLLPLPPVERGGMPPRSRAIHCVAEYEPMEGLLLSWEAYTSLLTEITVYVTTNTPPAKIFMVVDTVSEQNTVYNTLNGAGANMAYVEFIVRTTDTVWIRDYGPRYIFEDGIRTIIDHTYNRPRPNDNVLNDYLSQLWGEPQYDIPLVHGGGNFHLFANGDAFMSSLITAENPGLTEQDVIDLYAQYQNVDLTIYTGFPTSFDSTRHIDMWMFPAGDNKIIIGQYSPSTGQPYTITENAVADLISRGYTVYRTPGWNSGGTHYTYTNAIVINNLVMMSRFGGSYTTQDTQALAVFQQAFPGYTIRQLDSSGIITAAGALHCICMHVPAYPPLPEPVINLYAPDGGEVVTIGQTYEIRWSAVDDVGVTAVDLFLSTDGGATFPHTIAAGLPNTGLFEWTATGPATTQARVLAIAHDGDGNTGEDTSAGDFTLTPFGPQVVYEYTLDTNPGWTMQGGWGFGQPSGGGGEHGFPDPTSGHTGPNVYGYNLLGDYPANLPEQHLTTTAIDCSNLSGVTLKFWRWLGVERSLYDHAYVRVSNNYTTWTTVWQNPDAETADSAWVQQSFDISAVADGQPTVYVRWTMGTTDYTWQYCGWNIDDIQIVAVQASTPGDMDCDGDVDFDDIDAFVLALNGQAAYEAAYPDCNYFNGDCDGDGDVDFDDIDAFVALLSG